MEQTRVAITHSELLCRFREPTHLPGTRYCHLCERDRVRFPWDTGCATIGARSPRSARLTPRVMVKAHSGSQCRRFPTKVSRTRNSVRNSSCDGHGRPSARQPHSANARTTENVKYRNTQTQTTMLPQSSKRTYPLD